VCRASHGEGLPKLSRPSGHCPLHLALPADAKARVARLSRLLLLALVR
jgi:hypothetical protein